MDNNKIIRSFFQQFEILYEVEIDKIVSEITIRKINKGEFFITAGQVSTEFAFVKNGFFRHFIRDNNDVEKTYSLTFPNQIIAAYSSLISGDETKEYIESITDSELIIISLNSLEKVFKDNINWLKFSKLIVKTEYVELEKRIFSLLNDSPKERYLNLIEQKPHYVQQIPLKYISTYLGISQRHLSRLRKEI